VKKKKEKKNLKKKKNKKKKKKKKKKGRLFGFLAEVTASQLPETYLKQNCFYQVPRCKRMSICRTKLQNIAKGRENCIMKSMKICIFLLYTTCLRTACAMDGENSEKYSWKY